ncbi:peptide-O-fucosyltransferase [Clonorchis sinensis]|uniref:GDP-fucose protein O-fucosyltransferase 2 n=1 Tax=Clonorchis sinensis TaxID=79923 RepID=G7YEQ0_CLOSI|nr:peptide-O-fucosyltransferase [Clonorchis sinensis]
MANTVRLLWVRRNPSNRCDFRLLNLNRESSSPTNWTLVLPPWIPMSHWMTAASQLPNVTLSSDPLPWSSFFDLDSLSQVIPVMELEEFITTVLNAVGKRVDLAVQLFRNSVESFSGRLDSVKFCSEEVRSRYQVRGLCSQLARNLPEFVSSFLQSPDSLYYPPITLYPHMNEGHVNGDLSASRYDCITGALEPLSLAPFLEDLLGSIDINRSIKSIYLGSAEMVIHGQLSEWSAQYWTIRRSMVFASELRDVADEFRRTYLNSTDIPDHTFPPFSVPGRGPGSAWLHRKWPFAPAVGGPYLAVHWRCGDYVQSSGDRWINTPSPVQLASQIQFTLDYLASEHSTVINVVFLSTDANKIDVDDLGTHLARVKLVRFEPTPERWVTLGPGGIAIVDQWICSHARFFLGTNPSTFTFRIAEERTIMGFSFFSTFNTICPEGGVRLYDGSKMTAAVPASNGCEPLTAWPVVYEPAYTIYPEDKTHRPEL